MVIEDLNDMRCRQCSCVIGECFKGYVYCCWLNQDVWGDSLACDHGKDLALSF